jgi:hypothetical protein
MNVENLVVALLSYYNCNNKFL